MIRKRGFYVYYNKPKIGRKAFKIHHHICGECCFGIGKITNAEPGRNGVWIGPCNSIEALKLIINDISRSGKLFMFLLSNQINLNQNIWKT